jgi:hypothetical protein
MSSDLSSTKKKRKLNDDDGNDDNDAHLEHVAKTPRPASFDQKATQFSDASKQVNVGVLNDYRSSSSLDKELMLRGFLPSAVSALAMAPVGALSTILDALVACAIDRRETAVEQSAVASDITVLKSKLLNPSNVGDQKLTLVRQLLAFVGDDDDLVATMKMASRSVSLDKKLFSAELRPGFCVYISDQMSEDRWLYVIDRAKRLIDEDGRAHVAIVIGRFTSNGLSAKQTQLLSDFNKEYQKNSKPLYLRRAVEEQRPAFNVKAPPTTFREKLCEQIRSAAPDVVDIIRSVDSTLLPDDERQQSSQRRFIAFEELRVRGLGAFGKPPNKNEYVFSLKDRGIALVTADMHGIFSNGFGKTTLSITTILWCLTGLNEPRGVYNNTARKIVTSDLISDGCNEASVTLSILLTIEGLAPKQFVIQRSLLRGASSTTLMIGGNEKDLGVGQKMINLDIFGLFENNSSKKNDSDMLAVRQNGLRTHLLRTMFLTPGSSETLMDEATRSQMVKDFDVDPTKLLKDLKQYVGTKTSEFNAANSRLSTAKIAVARAKEQCEDIDRVERIKTLETRVVTLQAELLKLCGISHAESDNCTLDSKLEQATTKRVETQRDFRDAERKKNSFSLDSMTETKQTASNLETLYADVEKKLVRPTKRLGAIEEAQKHKLKKCDQCLQDIQQEHRDHLKTEKETLTTSIANLEEERDQIKKQQLYLDYQDAVTTFNHAKQAFDQANALHIQLSSDKKQHGLLEKELIFKSASLKAEQRNMDEQKDRLETETRELNLATTAIDVARVSLENASKAHQMVEICLQQTWKDVLRGIQSRAQEWLDHFFWSYSVTPDGRKLQYYGSSLTLEFRHKDGKDLFESETTDDWTPVVRVERHSRSTEQTESNVMAAESGIATSATTASVSQIDQRTSSTISVTDNYYSLAALSFSEFARVRIALFFACADQIMHRRNVRTNLFVLDECFAGVDTFGTLTMLLAMRMMFQSSALPIENASEKQTSILLSSAVNFAHMIGVEFDDIVAIDRQGLRLGKY